MYCPNCGSNSVHKNGTRSLSSGGYSQKYKCNECNKVFSVKKDDIKTTRFIPNRVLEGRKYVITSAQNNTTTNYNFFNALLNYCEKNKAELLVIPTLYQRNLYGEDLLEWDVPEEYLLEEKVSLNNKVNILASVHLLVTAENPLGGLDSLAKGNSLIVPHNQLQMRSLPVQRNEPPVVMISTGTISEAQYINSKAGEKASFNHSQSAILVEFDDDMDYHIRVLNCDDEEGFYDIDGYYSSSFKPLEYVEALITGDEHVFVTCKDVANATYNDTNSIVKTLKPKVIVRHDVLDCFTVSHHHRKDNFLQYSKYINNRNKIEEELEETINFILDTTPEGTETVVVSSNHHDHLKRWLNEADPKIEPWNAKIYHHLTWLVLNDIESKNEIYVPDPFRLYTEYKAKDKVTFIDRNSSFKIHGIELSNHGDIGANGSRGSISQFSKFSEKMIVGHSHTPGINKGAYSVGCSTSKNLEYTNGPSSWMNTHCVIYPNGKRQLISIINGKWRADKKGK